MTDKTMIEQMRNAIFAEAKKHGLSLTGPLLAEDPLVLLARAALIALREPTEAMLQAFVHQPMGLAFWQAGIDAALKENQP